jgi:hypothetical protein
MPLRVFYTQCIFFQNRKQLLIKKERKEKVHFYTQLILATLGISSVPWYPWATFGLSILLCHTKVELVLDAPCHFFDVYEVKHTNLITSQQLGLGLARNGGESMSLSREDQNRSSSGFGCDCTEGSKFLVSRFIATRNLVSYTYSVQDQDIIKEWKVSCPWK